MDWMRSMLLRKGQDQPLQTPRAPRDEEIRRDEEGFPNIICTESGFLQSQGLMIGNSGAALYHGTTSPPKYYEFRYNIQGGINMDRGGFGHASDGTNFGAVFDGVTAGGQVNAHAAQTFAEYTLRWLAAHKRRLHQLDQDRLAAEVHNIFTQCIDCAHNPGGEREAEGGSATGVLASCHRTARGRLMLVGATIGDASAVIVDPDGSSRIISRYKRCDATAKDTGGQLTMCMGVHGQVNAFVEPLTEQSIVVLTTDGFTDNILQTDFGNIIDIVLRAPFFDRGPERARQAAGNPSTLPALAELRALVGQLEDLDSVSCQSMVLRVSNYLKWVTKALYDREQAFYKLQIAMRNKTEAMLKKQDAMKRVRSQHQQSADDDRPDTTTTGEVQTTTSSVVVGSAESHSAASEASHAPNGGKRGEDGPSGEKQQHCGDGCASVCDGDCGRSGDDGNGPNDVTQHGHSGDSATADALEAEVAQLQAEIKAIEQECVELRKQQKQQRFAGKTDDALVVAMRPVWL